MIDLGVVASFLFGLVVFAACVVLLFVLITRGVRLVLGPRRRLEQELGADALRVRHHAGVISAEEYEQGLKLLGVDRPRD